jgi:acyl-CoA thioesterase FadM
VTVVCVELDTLESLPLPERYREAFERCLEEQP